MEREYENHSLRKEDKMPQNSIFCGYKNLENPDPTLYKFEVDI